MLEEVFYDNACHLHEYCLNIEPDLFKNTWFWHDLVHSIVHLCGINFKSTRVQGLDGINTEICEHVNSYLQSIKYTGAHLSQEHFVFFLQFFCIFLTKTKPSDKRKWQKLHLLAWIKWWVIVDELNIPLLKCTQWCQKKGQFYLLCNM